jgi:hypothetical protein
VSLSRHSRILVAGSHRSTVAVILGYVIAVALVNAGQRAAGVTTG